MMANRTKIPWVDILIGCKRMAHWARAGQFDAVYGIKQGGFIPAMLVSQLSGLPLLTHTEEFKKLNVLLVDEIADSGATRKKYMDRPFACLYKRHSCDAPVEFYGQLIGTDDWLVFPWEKDFEEA